jgi:hypothetical protein
VANADIVVVACRVDSGRSTWTACLWANLKRRYATLMLQYYVVVFFHNKELHLDFQFHESAENAAESFNIEHLLRPCGVSILIQEDSV